MSTQQDIYAAGSENRPPMLNKGNYVPWSSRLLWYAKSRLNGKLIHNSIINGLYVRRMIPEPGDTNREVPVNETFHVQTDDELTEKELKQIEADDQAIQTILLGLPEDIYAAVDSCETAQEIWLRVQQMMKGSDIRIQEKKANNLMFLNNLQPEWSRHVTIVHQTKDLHTADYTQLYDFLKYNQKENYMKQPMPNPENITDPTNAMNMALALMAKAFKLNYSTPTNNQRISSNPRNRQIAQPGMNMGQDRQMQMVGVQNPRIQNGVPGNANQNLNGNGNLVAAGAEGNAAGHNGNLIRCYNYRGVGHFARNCTIRPRRRDAADLQTQLLIAQKEEAGIQLQAKEFDLMAAAADLDEIEEVNANCILKANLQQASTSGIQTDKAPVYDLDGSAEVHDYENCYDNEIFNMCTQEEQYTKLLEPIPESHQVPQNDNDVISKVTSVEKSRGTVEQHPSNVEEIRALYDSLYQNLAIEVEKVNTVNNKLKETNADLTTELARFKNQEKCFEISQEKYEKLENVIKKVTSSSYGFVWTNENCQYKWKAEIWLRVQQMMKGSDIGIQEKKEKLFNEWERFTSNDGESIESYYHRFLKLMNDLKRNKHFTEKISTPHQDQPSFNQNYMQQPMPNPEDITDLTTAMNMALALTAKAFRLNYSTPTNNNQRISSNLRNRQIAQPRNANQYLNRNGNLVAARAEGNAAGHNGNQIRCYNCRGVGHFARNYTVRPRRRDAAYLQTQLLIAKKEEAGIQLQAEEFDLMAAAADLDEIEEVNANCILMANLQQASTSEVAFRRNACFDRNLEGVDLLKGDRSTNLYTINLHEMDSASPICLMARASSTKSWLWHQRVSHLNFDIINDLAKNNLVSGLPKFKYHKENLCPSCELGKSKRASHPPKPVPNSRQRLHLLHIDLCGPMRIASINGKRYVLVIVDDYSRYMWVHFLRSKDEAPEVIKTFLKRIIVLFQSLVIIIRTDNGTKFKNQILKEFFDSVGISHQVSSIRTPQQNRVVERINQTLVEATRIMLIFSHAPLILWAEAIATAYFTQKRSIIHRRFNKTPYDLINDRKLDISFLHVFGALCYPKNDHEDIGKLGAKGDTGFFIGYSTDSCAYRVYNRRTKKIMKTMNLSFDELSAMAFEQRSSKPGLQGMTSGQISSRLDLTYAPSTIITQQPTEGELDLLFEAMYDDFIGGQPSAAQKTVLAAQAQQDVDGLRTQQQHAQQQGNKAHLQSKTVADNVSNAMFDGNTFVNPFANLSTSAAESSSSQNVDPSNMHTFYQPYPYEFQWTKDHPLEQNVKEAMTDPAWIESMQEELLQFKRLDFKRLDVWMLVPTPDNNKPLTLKWLFKNKHDEENTVIRNKSRLVVRGHRQEKGLDFKKSFASIARMEAIRIFSVYVVHKSFTVFQMDVKTARMEAIKIFLAYDAHKSFTVFQMDVKTAFLHVKKALYGLKQAPRAWYDELLTFLLPNHFFKGTTDPTLFIRRTKKIMETMNVSFDELSAMAFEQRSSKPRLQRMTSGQISSVRDLTYAPSTITTQQPTEGELDLLFEAMYDDFIGGQPSAAERTVPAVQTQQVRQTSTTSTSIAASAPTPTNSSSQATNFPITSQDVDELNSQQQHVQQQGNQASLQPETIADNVPNALFDGNTFVNPFANPSTSATESSSSQNVDPSNMHTFYQPYPHEFQWTKDHPLEQ
nr:retrovirus-related Pol polyprotein from transposon TNT 1-94 [Tanacetum cinerariifolium]